MSKPIFKIGEHDYTKYLVDEGLKPSDNDLDADGSGRNLLDGLMYRNRIATKEKWTVSFLRLNETVMSRLLTDMDADYVHITMLDAKANRYITRTYYCSTINKGIQRYVGGRTVYDGVTFNITER
jgi:hypothetical protein